MTFTGEEADKMASENPGQQSLVTIPATADDPRLAYPRLVSGHHERRISVLDLLRASP